MSGSPSSAPSLTDTSEPSGHVPPNRLEPHCAQNALDMPPSGGRNTRMLSAPATKRNPSRGTRPWAEAELPECLRQREQWQKFARRNGIEISNRTAPQRQLPDNGMRALGATPPDDPASAALSHRAKGGSQHRFLE